MFIDLDERRTKVQTMNYHSRRTRSTYKPPDPSIVETVVLKDLLELNKRGALEDRQFDLLRENNKTHDVSVFIVGDIHVLEAPCVSVVGTRNVSAEGYARATRLARELVTEGVTVVSGLAKGVDTAAHTSAIENGGKTAAVIGTPLNKAYPAENAHLQERIYRDHLLVSPFSSAERTYKGNFPKRNRVMAALSDATVIVEASDTSGTLHQAAECQRLGRWLFILKSVAENEALSWPKKFIGKDKVGVVTDVSEIIEKIR